MSPYIYSLLAIVITSFVSLIGVTTLALKKDFLKRIMTLLVGFATGALFGDVFIHLLPEITEKYGFDTKTSISILFGILVFFILEKLIHWHHCHSTSHEDEKIHPAATLNLIGDAVHNVIDGMLITASFLITPQVGITTTIAVLLHEIPQEIGDFGVLIHSGMKPRKALMLNLFTAFSSVLGILIVMIVRQRVNDIESFLLPITAGGFIYIAGSDLIPELHHNTSVKASILQLISIMLGVFVMYSLVLFE